jgi:hypothetical protein
MPDADQVARERAITALLGPIARCDLAIPIDSHARHDWIGALSHLRSAHRAQALFASSLDGYLEGYAMPAKADRAIERGRCAVCLVRVAAMHLADVAPVAAALADVWGKGDPATASLLAISARAAIGQPVTE